MWKSLEVESEGLPLNNQPSSSGGEAKELEQAPARRWTKCQLGCIACIGLSLVLFVGIIAATTSLKLTEAVEDPLDTGPCVSDCPHCRKNVRLPPAEPLPTSNLTMRTDPWYILNNVQGKQPAVSYDPTNDAIRVDYIPRLWGSHNGADFKFNPRMSLPAESAVLSYKVYFPEDFPWTRGGKLPGFCISESPRDCATGSEWAWSAGSLRMMWRQGGRAIGYVYLPLQVGIIPARWSTWSMQGSSYKKVASDTGSTGDDVFCHVDGGLILKAGEWNEVTMLVAMNTPGLANGWLSLQVNGETRTVKGVRWRGLTKKVQVSSVLFATFFGGSDETWATEEKAYALFKEFKVTAPAALGASNI